MGIIQHTHDPKVISDIASHVTYGGGGAALFLGLTANEIAAYGGLTIAFLGLCVNILFKYKNYKLNKEKKL